MALFGLFKKKEAKPAGLPISEPDIRHIDDLDIPSMPSEKELEPEVPLPKEAASEESKEEGKHIPEELPPIEEVPSYEDEFLPLPEHMEESAKPAQKAGIKLEQKEERIIPASPVWQQRPMTQPEIIERRLTEKKEIPYFYEGGIEEEPLEGELRPANTGRSIFNQNYMKLSNYKYLLNEATSLKVELLQASKTLTRIKQVKNPEDSEFNVWKETLEDIERKILYIDKTIFG